MAEDSKIEWTSHTFNPWRGCTKVSPGCANCYADAMSGRNPSVLGVWGPNGTRVVAAESYWRDPLKWNKVAALAEQLAAEAVLNPPKDYIVLPYHRPRVFCASLADVFEGWPGQMTNSSGAPLWTGPLFHPGDGSHTHWWRGGERGNARPLDQCHVLFRLFDLIRRTPHLDWLLLTKRPHHINHALGAVTRTVYGATEDTDETICWLSNWRAGVAVPKNVWLGTSVENQAAADERIPHLLSTPAAVRFLSCEPLLGPVHLRGFGTEVDTVNGRQYPRGDSGYWVIVGGESGRDARPFAVEWGRALVQQCRAAGVACFVKQLGAVIHATNIIDPLDQFPGGGKSHCQGPGEDTIELRLKSAKGGDPEEWPSDLRVREFPTVQA